MLRRWMEERSELEFQMICLAIIVTGLLCLQFAYRALALHDIEIIDADTAGDPASTTGPREPVPEPAAPSDEETHEEGEPEESEGE